MSLCVAVFIATGAGAQSLRIPSFETGNVKIIYTSSSQYYLVPHLASCFENAYRFHSAMYDYRSAEKTSILFHDFGDWGYGGANSIPSNIVIIGIEPFEYLFDLLPSNERMNWVMNHELLHIVACDKPNATDRFFRSLFIGKVATTPDQPLTALYSYLASPRRYSPRWYHEGYAVFMETWMAGGMGRSLGGYDEMVFRAMVRDSNYFYSVLGLESEGTTIDFQVGANSYLYGARFINYLGQEYGPELLRRWYARTDSSERYFSDQFRAVYHKDVDDAWNDWIAFERRWQTSNLETIRQYPVTQFRTVGSTVLGSVSRQFRDTASHSILVAVNFPGQLSSIASVNIATGTLEPLCDMPTPALYGVASLAYDDSSRTMFYTTNNSANWRTLNAFSLGSGRTHVLLDQARIGDIAFNKADKALYGIRHENGYSTLVRVLPPYEKWETIRTFPYGSGLIDLDCSPDGASLTGTATDITGRQILLSLNIQSALAGTWRPDTVYEFADNSASNFIHSSDGKFLYGTSYLTGVSNVFRIDIRTKKMEALSNIETGFFRPLPMGNDSIVVFHYSGKGFSPALIKECVIEDVAAVKYLGQRVVEKFPDVKNWKLSSPALINIDSLALSTAPYDIIGSAKVTGLYPVVEGYKEFPAYGLRTTLNDPLSFASITTSLSYSPTRLLPEKERWHGALEARYWEWTLDLSYNKADFYDLFGPTKSSRAGYSAGLHYSDILVDEKPVRCDYSFGGSYYGGLDRLPDYQNVSTAIDAFGNIGGDIHYSYIRRSLGGVDDEAGYKWALLSRNYVAQSALYPRVFGTADYGVLLPLIHSSVWFRGAAGSSFGDRASSFSNFYFGGFGNNWVDYLDARRFRAYYSFPGAGLNSIGGSNFAKGTVEWDLPPLRFRELGWINFFCNWSQLVLFSSTLVTDLDKTQGRTESYNLGGQLDFRLSLFTILESTLSFGAARAWMGNNTYSDEFMVSLKLLK